MDGFLSFQTNSAQKVLTHSPCSASHALRQAALSEKRPNTTLPEPVIADVFGFTAAFAVTGAVLLAGAIAWIPARETMPPVADADSGA